jgi:hypothetical protein
VFSRIQLKKLKYAVDSGNLGKLEVALGQQKSAQAMVDSPWGSDSLIFRWLSYCFEPQTCMNDRQWFETQRRGRLYERLQKKVRATQKLKSCHREEQLKTFLFEFNFCVAITFFPIKSRYRSHNV